ncbi:unnamed protein product, partial [Prorocentrum cordatum]
MLLMVDDPTCTPRTCFMFLGAQYSYRCRCCPDLSWCAIRPECRGRSSRGGKCFPGRAAASWVHAHTYEFEQSAFAAFLLSGQGLPLHDPPPGLEAALRAVTWDRVEYPPQRFVEQQRHWTGTPDRIALYHRSGCPLEEKLHYMRAALAPNRSAFRAHALRFWRPWASFT